MENVEQLASDSNVRKTSDVDSTVNPAVVASEYAVRGAIASRAACIEEDLKSGIGSYDFDGILYCNIGNPQALAQKPVSYGRRLVACCECQEVRIRHPRTTIIRAADEQRITYSI